jgi:5-methyltetrahydropteroyltriglutamate--homocysteine methyltransferase
VNPKIQTTTVGSFPAPSWCGPRPVKGTLDDAARVIIALQKEAGVDLVTDGEVERRDPDNPLTGGMVGYFVYPLSGVRKMLTAAETADARIRGVRPPFAVVEGILGPGSLDLPAACVRGRTLTRGAKYKFTLSAPHLLASTIADRHYGDKQKLTMAIADILAVQAAGCDADVVQVDEAALPRMPQDWRFAADAMNKVLDAIRGKRAVHLCLGNYGGQRAAGSKTLDHLLGYLNTLHADHVVLECKRNALGSLEAFRDLNPKLKLGLGVVDIKSTEAETPDEVAADLERFERILGPGRVEYIHPDCGFVFALRNVIEAKLQAMVQGRDLYEGRNTARVESS